MDHSKKHYPLLLIGVLLLLTSIPADDARADVGLPPAQPGYSLSTGEYDTNIQMVSEAGAASVSLTTPAPTATTSAPDPTGSDVELDSPNASPSIPFSLIMGGGFISIAVVLIIIAVRRGEK